MKIQNIALDTAGPRTRIAARVIWEESNRPACDVHFSTDRAFGDALAPLPDPFLAAALTPALWAGERRIAVDDDVCPTLLENLEQVAALFRHWFGAGRAGFAIEARARAGGADPVGQRRAAVFFSGGIDSLAACRANRLRYPVNHPASLCDGILVFGFEIEDEVTFGYAVDALAPLAAETGLTLIPVSTNLRVLNPDWQFWYTAHMGPALCAVAHALGRRVAHVTIGSDYDLAHVVPHGSHPMVEPWFSSHDLTVHYHGLTLSRLAKTRLLAEWPMVLRHLRVCNRPDAWRPGRLNCGSCEKCIRTMLELVAVGAFEDAPVFIERSLTPEMIASLYIPPAVEPYYQELVQPIAAAGRTDLAAAIARRLAVVRGELGLTGLLRRLDRIHLNGSMVLLKRALTTLRPTRQERQEAR